VATGRSNKLHPIGDELIIVTLTLVEGATIDLAARRSTRRISW